MVGRVVIGALVIALGEAVFSGLDLMLLGRTSIVLWRMSHAVFCLAVAAVLLWRQEELAAWWSHLAFAAVTLPLVGIFWTSEAAVAATHQPWTPFVGNKLLIFGIALLDPGPLWLGVGLMSVFALEAAYQWTALDIAVPSWRLVAGEPWVTLFYAVVAIILLVYRTRAAAYRRAARRAEEATRINAELASLALAVNDLANTPLQTLAFGVVLLRRGEGGAETIAAMDRAVTRLETLGVLLERFPPHRGAPLSFDAESIMRPFNHEAT